MASTSVPLGTVIDPLDDILGCLSSDQKEIDSLSAMLFHLKVSTAMEHESSIRSLIRLGELKVNLILKNLSTLFILM